MRDAQKALKERTDDGYIFTVRYTALILRHKLLSKNIIKRNGTCLKAGNLIGQAVTAAVQKRFHAVVCGIIVFKTAQSAKVSITSRELPLSS